MARLAKFVVAVTTILTAASLPSPATAHAVSDPGADQAAVEHLAFEVGINTFMNSRGVPAHLDWSTDRCSAPLTGDTGRSFDFTKACIHHDFGYRNFKLLDRRFACAARAAGTYCASGTWSYGWFWNETVRKRIDDRFLGDMKSDCSPRPWTQKYSCLAWAQTYYSAVRNFGD